MRIRELEEENHMLAERASSASQRFADYENEIRVLRQRLREQQERHNAAAPLTPDSEHPNSLSTPERLPTLSRFGSFMRKPSLAATPTAREQELEASLSKEQAARKEADRKVKEVNAEIEELSASLFQQANDMVAAERKENALLKAKIKELETGGSAAEAVKRENDILRRKIEGMERRDTDTKRRLDKLEAAQKRIDRVRAMLVPR